jgi:hypothetical protein
LTNSRTFATLCPYSRTDDDGGNFTALSLYTDEPFCPKACFKELATLTELYGISKEYVCILVEALNNNHFTNLRFKDSVRNVVETFKFQKPTIADFVSYDDFIRLYSWHEKNKLVQNGAPNDDFFLVGLLANIAHYVRVSEVAKLPETKKQTVRNFASKLRNVTLNK